jgi:hypothetical protein
MAEDSAGSPLISQVGGIIPHFYFDLIGRVVPGGLFLIGLGVLYFPDGLHTFWCMFVPPIDKDSGAYLIFAATLSLLALSLVGYIVRSLLGTISYIVFESRWRKIGMFPVLDAATVFHKSFPLRDALQKRFRHHFGENFADQPFGNLTDYSRLCSYFVWAKNVNLGQMTARWDAEALAGRNVLFGATALLLLRTIQIGINCRDIFEVRRSLSQLRLFSTTDINDECKFPEGILFFGPYRNTKKKTKPLRQSGPKRLRPRFAYAFGHQAEFVAEGFNPLSRRQIYFELTIADTRARQNKHTAL